MGYKEACLGPCLPGAIDNRRLLDGRRPELQEGAGSLVVSLLESGLLRRRDALNDRVSAACLPCEGVRIMTSAITLCRLVVPLAE
jgi:hypothetical protein